MTHFTQYLQHISYIWWQELKTVFRDPGIIIFFLVVPLAYPLIYGLIYNPETVHEVPLAVVDQSGSFLSREFIRRMDASPDVKIAGIYANQEDAQRLLDEKKAYGILYIPEKFSTKIHRGEQTAVSLYCDMGSLLYYKAFLMTATEVSMQLATPLSPPPVLQESVPLYNTQNGFASFLIPGILVLVLHQTLLLGIGMLAATAREKNYEHQLIPPSKQYAGTLRVVMGKSLAYFSIYIPVSIWALVIVPAIFQLPQIGSIGALIGFIIPFLFASIFFSMSIGCFMKEREYPMLLLVFTSVPLLFISGVSWPWSAISSFWQVIGSLIPSTMGIQGFIKINSMGASLPTIMHEYKGLWLLTGIYFITTCLFYRRQILRASRLRKQKLISIRKRSVKTPN